MHNMPKPKKKTAKKKVTVSSLKKKLWVIFSQYIRQKNANAGGIGKCITCGVVKPWKELQASHYISRMYSSTLFDETNVAPACYACNVMMHGNLPSYVLFLDEKYGVEKKYELYKKSKEVKRFSTPELEQMIEDYKTKLSQLQ